MAGVGTGIISVKELIPKEGPGPKEYPRPPELPPDVLTEEELKSRLEKFTTGILIKLVIHMYYIWMQYINQ